MKTASLLLFLVFAAACSGQKPALTNLPQRTSLMLPLVVYNPYRVSVDIELKCESLKTRWVLPAKGSVVLWIPPDVARCELWPTVKFWR